MNQWGRINTHHLGRVTGSNTQTFAYDAAGNTTNRNGTIQAFDDRNRLSQSTTGGNTTSYTYNAIGERSQKATPTATTQYLYNPQGQLLVESSSDQSRQKEYAYLNGQPMAVWHRNTSGGSTTEAAYYFHNDHLGTPQVMSDANQTTVWQADYDPFGKATVTVGTIENNLRFPGQYFDQESGLHYNYFRFYDPSLGRYSTPDPLGIIVFPKLEPTGKRKLSPLPEQPAIQMSPVVKADPLNHLYGYANQNPVMNVDPTGEFSIPGTSGGGSESSNDGGSSEQMCAANNDDRCNQALVDCRLNGGDPRACAASYNACLQHPGLWVIFPGFSVPPL